MHNLDSWGHGTILPTMMIHDPKSYLARWLEKLLKLCEISLRGLTVSLSYHEFPREIPFVWNNCFNTLMVSLIDTNVFLE